MTATATSIEAHAEEEASGRNGQLRWTVYRALKQFGASTARELAERSGLDPSTQKRLSELVKMGRAERLGERVCSVSGKTATVWRATDGDAPVRTRGLEASRQPDLLALPTRGPVAIEVPKPKPDSGGTGARLGACETAPASAIVARWGDCHKCAGRRLLVAHPHSPRFRADGMLVDCVGEVIS